MTPEQRKLKIRELREKGLRLQSEANHLQYSCPHTIKPQEPDGVFGYGYAECAGCDAKFGWYCPDSPDRVCHYESCDGQVELLDGTKVTVPADHDAKHDSSDWCIFCGHPDERK